MLKIKQLSGLLPLALAIACGKGGESTEQIHEKEGSDEAAIMAGWDITPSTLESEHPLGNDLTKDFTVDAPDGTRKFRVVFRQIRMENGYDYLVIRDGSGTELERVTGWHRNYVSRTIQGERATITVETDYSVGS